MKKSDLLAKLDYFDMVHRVTMRAIATFTDADIDFRPQPEMRTPKELVFHIYAQEKTLADCVRIGRFDAEAAARSSPESPAVAAELRSLTGIGTLQTFADECHRSLTDAFRSLSEEALASDVESPFGTYPAWRYFEFAYDEHWHHRGQLYTYLRLRGKEPPMLYDY